MIYYQKKKFDLAKEYVEGGKNMMEKWSLQETKQYASIVGILGLLESKAFNNYGKSMRRH